MIISIFLIISILTGQLIKLHLFGNIGPTLLDLCVLLFCIFGLFRLKFKLFDPPKFIKFGLLFIVISLLSLAFTPLPLDTAEYIASFSYIVRFSLFILAGWLLYKDFSQTLLISGIGLAILGLLQFLLLPNLIFLQSFGWDPHYFRTVSTFLDPNFAGAYFVLTLVLLTSVRSGISRKSNLLILAWVITYLALMTTFSRSSYLMFLASGVSLAFFKKSKVLFLAVLLLFLLLMGVFYSYNQTVATERGIDREQSASLRLNTWQQGIEIFKHSPILGVGFNSYKYAIKEYNLGDSQFLESRGSTSNDSSLLYVLATTGILGLLTYLLFIFHLGKNNSILKSSILGLLIHSFFANSLFYPPILLWIIFLSFKKESK